MRATRVVAGVALATSILFVTAPVQAWPVPSVTAAGGGCAGSVRAPVVWAVTNLETAFPLSPARIEEVRVTPSLPTSAFLPGVLPNTGNATASATTAVPPSFAGTVTLSFRMVWTGPDGSDQRDASVSVPVQACPQASAATTTTTTPTTTSTTTTTTTTTSVAAPPVEAVAVRAETASADAVEPGALGASEPVIEQAVRPAAVQAQPQFTG